MCRFAQASSVPEREWYDKNVISSSLSSIKKNSPSSCSPPHFTIRTHLQNNVIPVSQSSRSNEGARKRWKLTVDPRKLTARNKCGCGTKPTFFFHSDLWRIIFRNENVKHLIWIHRQSSSRVRDTMLLNHRQQTQSTNEPPRTFRSLNKYVASTHAVCLMAACRR